MSSAIGMLAVLPGCSASQGGKGQGTGEQSTGEQSSGDAGAASSCSALENAAAETFEAFVDQHASCTSDADCTLVHFTEPSFCASPCPVVMNQTGAASAVDVASQDCAPFDAQGCAPPLTGCPGFGSPICAGGTCALYELSLTESGSFTHGACTSLTMTYEQSWAPRAAPRDFPLTVTATDGALYADGACTTALSSGEITLSQGSTSVTFGFIPAAVGPFAVSIDGGGNPAGISGDAQ